MRNRSNLSNIFLIIIGLVLASMLLKVLLSITGGILYLVFKFAVPLLIIIGIVYGLSHTNKGH
ncbi:MAG TPA: hypothetical protein VK118_06720 [Tetragenococcus sp.]|nr:hypothetical protein [Tetragenococcus sp.]